MVDHVVDVPAGRFATPARDGILAFRGIPYAEPPRGEARFQAPRRRARLTGVFRAERWGATPQRVPIFADPVVPTATIDGDDILNLNVYTTADALGSSSLPVLFWLHGGGYRAGSSASPWFDGASFARHGVVVVTANYRLGVEGFAALDGAASNRGMRDWICALEWVQENIGGFGGDAGRVTMAGQSAGGGAVLALLASPHSAGLVAGGWSMSGTLTTTESGDARSATRTFARVLGVEPTPEGFASFDSGTLQRLHNEHAPIDDDALLDGRIPGAFGPVVDGDLVPDATATGLSVRGTDLPLVVGCTADEFDRPGANRADPERVRAALVRRGLPGRVAEEYVARGRDRLAGARVASDLLFRSVPAAVLGARGPARSSTWCYDYRLRSTATGTAGHCFDIPAFFGVPRAEGVRRRLGDLPAAVVRELHGDAVAFATTGRLPWEPAGQVRVYDAPLGWASDVDPVAALLSPLWTSPAVGGSGSQPAEA